MNNKKIELSSAKLKKEKKIKRIIKIVLLFSHSKHLSNIKFDKTSLGY